MFMHCCWVLLGLIFICTCSYESYPSTLVGHHETEFLLLFLGRWNNMNV
jgi:hypothetical protein